MTDIGYVCFKDPANAVIAMTAMNRKVLSEGRVLIVNPFISKKNNELAQNSRVLDPITQNLTSTFNSNVYVKFIPNEVTEEQLRNTFKFDKDVEIHSLKLNKATQRFADQEVTPYQFAYVLFGKVSDAQKAIQHFDGQYVFGGSRPLSVEMWVSKEEKEQEKKRKEDRSTK